MTVRSRFGRMVTSILVLAACMAVALPATAHEKDGAAEPAPLQGNRQQAEWKGVVQVGFLPLGGDNGDVWLHKGYAYVGSYGRKPEHCPAKGVRVVDVSDPARPEVVSSVATIADTSQEDVMVAHIETPNFHGELLVTGVQACTESAKRGMDLWDVSNPRAPRHLAFWPSNLSGWYQAKGVHELFLFQQGDRAFVAATVPFSERSAGDLRIIDVTDPTNPLQVGSWGVRRDTDLHSSNEQTVYGHGVHVNKDGTRAFVSYWDAGEIILDIANPWAPSYIGRAGYWTGADGATHSSWLTADEQTLYVADEDSNLADHTWGYLRVFDVRDQAAPQQVGAFRLPETYAGDHAHRPGIFSIHNPFILGNKAYLSWYSDGVRVLDISDPLRPREEGYFIPKDSPDPGQHFPGTALVWGVHSDGRLIVASDINSGLYILRQVVAANVTINGTPLQFSPSAFGMDGRTLAPIRPVAEALGAQVQWDNDAKRVTVVGRGHVVEVTLNNRTAFRDGQAVQLDVPAMAVDDRIIVPLRFIAESLGATVGWDNTTQTVLVQG